MKLQLLAGGALVALLAGCGSSQAPAQSAPPPPQVTVRSTTTS